VQFLLHSDCLLRFSLTSVCDGTFFAHRLFLSLSISQHSQFTPAHTPIAAENGVNLGDHLESLVKDAEARLQEMAAMPVTDVGNDMHSLGGGTGSEKQRAMWERRVRSLKKMLLGFEQSSAL
jgi:hypothetical protein